MITTSLLLYAIIIVIGYALVANRMMKFGGRFRDKALELGVVLLDDPRVPANVKKNIEGMLPELTSRWVAWCFVVLITPAAIGNIFKHWSDNVSANSPQRSDPYWKTWDDYTIAVLFSVLCNSPLAAALFLIQLFGLSFLVIPHALIWRLMMSATHDNRRWFQHA